jgi:MFS family permease
MREIGIPAESLGLLTGVFFFTHAAMQLPNGVFLDRYGPRIVYTVSLCLLCIGTVMFAFAESVTGLFVARFFMGLGASALVLGAMVLFSRWYPSDRFPQMIAIVISISNIGTLSATTPLAAAILTALIATYGATASIFSASRKASSRACSPFRRGSQ